jgi:hypothetical protein
MAIFTSLSLIVISLLATSSFLIKNNGRTSLTSYNKFSRQDTSLGDVWSFGKDLLKRLNGVAEKEKESEVLWLPFLQDGRSNPRTLLMYLTFYLGVTRKGDWIGLGTWRIKPNDAIRNLAVESQEFSKDGGKRTDEEEFSFRMMFMETMPQGVFGTADLKFEIYTGEQPGLKVSRFRPSQTPGSRQSEVELMDIVIENLEQIANDYTIKPENRIFETSPYAFKEARNVYIQARKTNV